MTARFFNEPAHRHGARYRAHGWWRDTTFVDDQVWRAVTTADALVDADTPEDLDRLGLG